MRVFESNGKIVVEGRTDRHLEIREEDGRGVRIQKRTQRLPINTKTKKVPRETFGYYDCRKSRCLG